MKKNRFKILKSWPATATVALGVVAMKGVVRTFRNTTEESGIGGLVRPAMFYLPDIAPAGEAE